MHDKFKADLWNKSYCNKDPDKTWMDAVNRWIKESGHKRSLSDDIYHLKWVDKYLRHFRLYDISRDVIDRVSEERTKTGVKPATINRMLEIIRAILRKAVNEWEWLDKVPIVSMIKHDNKRIRWLSHDDAKRLLTCLPSHLRDMAAFTLATGLRASNVKGLRWKQVDLDRKHAYIRHDESKTKKAIPVPLNEDAINIVLKQNRNTTHVFTYKDNSINECNTKAWRKALKKAEIENFRWHDLRHTWASWHVQNGTSLQELQILGGWASFEMVLRYAHLSSDHLKEAANRIVGLSGPAELPRQPLPERYVNLSAHTAPIKQTHFPFPFSSVKIYADVPV